MRLSSLDPIGYAYDADLHCPTCTAERFGADLDTVDAEDSEGNPIGALFSWNEFPDGAWCGDCHESIVEPDASETGSAALAVVVSGALLSLLLVILPLLVSLSAALRATGGAL